MATTPNRIAANRANARKSTGPKTPGGKARSSQNARKHPFDPDPFAIVRIEDRAQLAARVAGAIATYQPINSQERDAVERIALAQHSMRRLAILEAGFFTNCLDQAMEGPARPFVLERAEITNGIDIPLEQHRAYWLAFGLNRFTGQSSIAATLLRFQAQAERLHRRAVEDFHRLLKLRDVLPPEKYEEASEPNPEPVAAPQPTENTAAPAAAQPVVPPPNEPNTEPSPAADRRSTPRPSRKSSHPPAAGMQPSRVTPRDEHNPHATAKTNVDSLGELRIDTAADSIHTIGFVIECRKRRSSI